MTDTAVTRLHALCNGDPWVYPRLVADPDTEPTVTLTRADATALLAIIADGCDVHGACELCGTAICEDCGLGEYYNDPACGRTHCAATDCLSTCRDCWDEVLRDEEADRAYDIARGK